MNYENPWGPTGLLALPERGYDRLPSVTTESADSRSADSRRCRISAPDRAMGVGELAVPTRQRVMHVGMPNSMVLGGSIIGDGRVHPPNPVGRVEM